MVGRPSEYEATKTASGVSTYVSDCKSNNYLPTIEGLAVLGVWRSTLYDWADPKSDVYHPEFHDIFEQLRAAQVSQLLQNGLVNNYNSTITKLMLTKHGHNDIVTDALAEFKDSFARFDKFKEPVPRKSK